MKYKDYEDLVKGLKNLPVTLYPALITEMVKTAYKKKVFMHNMASVFVKKQCEEETPLDSDEIIREILNFVEAKTEGLDVHQFLKVLDEVMEDLNEQYNVMSSEINGHNEDLAR